MSVNPTTLSAREARRIAIQAAGLNRKFAFGKGKAAVSSMLDQLGYIQVDSISVVARAHHHMCRSRVPNYHPSILGELQASGAVLEYWHHAAAYLPMEHFRFSLPLKSFFADEKDGWPKAEPNLQRRVYEIILNEGPKRVRDFNKDANSGRTGWWNWKPAKWALERLFFSGRLTCIGRIGFEKVYDVTERAIPSWVDQTAPTPTEYAQHVIDSALRRFGIATEKEVTYLLKVHRKEVKALWRDMISDSRLQLVVVGRNKLPYFMASEPTAIRVSKMVKILSPFDPLVIQRERLARLFQFDYQLECYVPKAKRQRGYLALPLLYGDQFIGSLDAKADRKQKRLLIQNLLIEKPLDEVGLSKLETALRDFALFNECAAIEVVRSNIPIQV